MNKKLSNSKKSLRRHDHDWLRVMAILLIFVYHAAAPFHPWFDWHIRAYPKSELIGYLSAAGYSWPLPLFMLLAGAATWFALRKRSYRQYAGERFTRILLPLIAAMIILIPPQVYMERLQRFQFTGSFLEYLPHALDGGPYPQGNISAGQFWFLFYLLFYALLALPLFAFLRGKTGQRWLSRLAEFSQRRGAILIFAVPLIIGQIALGWRFPETHNPINDWMFHLQLFLVFVFGFILFSDGRFERGIDRSWLLILILAIATSLGMFFLFFSGPAAAVDAVRGYLPARAFETSEMTAYYLLGSSLLRLNTWVWLLLLLWLARKFLSFTNRFLAYASPAAFPVFILHQTIIIIVAFYVVQWQMDILPKFLAILSISLIITLVIYELARRWRVTRFVLGAKPSAKPSQTKSKPSEPKVRTT
jgi:peptidoglycan/LPS O-acetylase OafA/YrhL